MKSSAVFLDRDGVINANRPDYVRRWEDFEFLPGAPAAMRDLTALGWPIVVATNQSAVGRGLMTAPALAKIHRRMLREVERVGGRIDLVATCPHTPHEGCACRKPNAALFLGAAERLGIDLTSSYFVGDAATDLSAARRLGMTFVLVATGAEALIRVASLLAQADFVADGLQSAARWILAREGLTPPGLATERTA